jgi:hypothetical protein
MPEPQPKKPWWRKERWWAGAFALGVVAYPILLGPVRYCASRGWIPWQVCDALWRPIDAYNDYLNWWGDLAWRHDGEPFRGM